MAKIKKFITVTCLIDFFGHFKTTGKDLRNTFFEMQTEILTGLKNAPFEHKLFMVENFTEVIFGTAVTAFFERTIIKIPREQKYCSFVPQAEVATLVIRSLTECYMFQSAKYQNMGLGLQWSDTVIMLGTHIRSWPEISSFMGVYIKLKKTHPIPFFYRKPPLEEPIGIKIATPEESYARKWVTLNFLRLCRLLKWTYPLYTRRAHLPRLQPNFRLSKRTRIIYLMFSRESSKSYSLKPVTLEKQLLVLATRMKRLIKIKILKLILDLATEAAKALKNNRL